jgi:molecular chaperone HscB
VNDPFELLGVEPKFALDVTDLETRHRELSRVLHPDRHVGESASARRLTLSRAIEVNQAFQVLRDPVRRAEALLSRRGVTIEEGRDKAADPMLLMELLEFGESISEARRARDRAAIERKFSELKARENESLSTLGSAFEAGEAGTERVVKEIGMLRFTRRLLDEAALALDELE